MLRVSAKLDYAVRALTELARVAPEHVKGDVLAARQCIPFRFLEVTLGELRQAGLVHSRRGTDGGYWIERSPAEITLAEISIAVEGGLVDLRSVPHEASDGTAALVQEVWEAAHRGLAHVLTSVTLADVAAGNLPPEIRAMSAGTGGRVEGVGGGGLAASADVSTSGGVASPGAS